MTQATSATVNTENPMSELRTSVYMCGRDQNRVEAAPLAREAIPCIGDGGDEGEGEDTATYTF